MHRTVSIIAASNLRVRKIREAGETVFALVFWFLQDPGPCVQILSSIFRAQRAIFQVTVSVTVFRLPFLVSSEPGALDP